MNTPGPETRPDPHEALAPSVLDRLLDDDPDGGPEAPRARGAVERQIQAAVRRDLQDLLNSHPVLVDAALPTDELQRSLLAYGVPDFTGVDVASNAHATTLLHRIRSAIERFEPRLREPRVELLGEVEPTDPRLRFRIRARLVVHPLQQAVAFDSELEPATGNITVGVVAR